MRTQRTNTHGDPRCRCRVRHEHNTTPLTKLSAGRYHSFQADWADTHARSNLDPQLARGAVRGVPADLLSRRDRGRSAAPNPRATPQGSQGDKEHTWTGGCTHISRPSGGRREWRYAGRERMGAREGALSDALTQPNRAQPLTASRRLAVHGLPRASPPSPAVEVLRGVESKHRSCRTGTTQAQLDPLDYERPVAMLAQKRRSSGALRCHKCWRESWTEGRSSSAPGRPAGARARAATRACS